MDSKPESPPVAESFRHNGKLYTLLPITLNGTNVDAINAAVHRARVGKAMAAIANLDRLVEADKSMRGAVIEMKASIMEPVANFTPLDMREISDAVRNDPDVVADVIFRTSPECKSLAEAEKLVDEYPNFVELGLRCFIASGMQEVGNSPALAVLAGAMRARSGGDVQAHDEQLSKPIESQQESTKS